jgi:hypothetical protein
MPVKFQDNIAVAGFPSRDWENFRGAGLRKTAFYKFNTTSSTGGYIHMKTNIPVDKRAWYMIEATGYNYGLSKDIYCFWGFRPNLIPSQVKAANSSRTEGLVPQNTQENGIYISEDDFVVIYAYASSYYYIGFALNLYAATSTTFDPGDPGDPYYIPDVQVVAASLNQSGGRYY